MPSGVGTGANMPMERGNRTEGTIWERSEGRVVSMWYGTGMSVVGYAKLYDVDPWEGGGAEGGSSPR
ncbi:hypothetical protein H0H87_005347, partial [Tephrocybe sp. NHM501043]